MLIQAAVEARNANYAHIASSLSFSKRQWLDLEHEAARDASPIKVTRDPSQPGVSHSPNQPAEQCLRKHQPSVVCYNSTDSQLDQLNNLLFYRTADGMRTHH